MNKPVHTGEIFLPPGEVYFGGRGTRIRTLLGSCVAITMWHPDLLQGGMCHYMLPSRRMHNQALHCRLGVSPIGFPSRRARLQKPLDGKYADEALELMFSEIKRNGAPVHEYEVKMFGGGNMFSLVCEPSKQHVGLKNILAASALLARYGLTATAEHAGGAGHRSLIFDIKSGHVWMKHQTPEYSPCDTCGARELCPHH